MAHRLSCSAACGIFPSQGQDLCALHWQVYSWPLDHQGSSLFCFCFFFFNHLHILAIIPHLCILACLSTRFSVFHHSNFLFCCAWSLSTDEIPEISSYFVTESPAFQILRVISAASFLFFFFFLITEDFSFLSHQPQDFLPWEISLSLSPASLPLILAWRLLYTLSEDHVYFRRRACLSSLIPLPVYGS